MVKTDVFHLNKEKYSSIKKAHQCNKTWTCYSEFQKSLIYYSISKIQQFTAYLAPKILFLEMCS